MPLRTENLRDRIHIELVRSLFATVAPTTIMSAGFVVSAGLIVSRDPDPLLLTLAIAGALASVVRLAIVRRACPQARQADLCIERARLLERRFAVSYLAFAITLGLFGAGVMMLDRTDAHMLMICLLVGYAAGVAAGVALRPWIAIPSMVAAVGPAILAVGWSGDPLHWATGIMMAAFLAGGIHSLLQRYHTTCKEIGQRITFAGLARRDGLTALPNRLALREWFDSNVSARADRSLVAIHCLDLDRFKPVNDRYGHPTGDELLRAVALRLARSLRPGDIAARLGGDEFAVIQQGLTHAGEAELLAQRLAKSIKVPFQAGRHELRVSACVGYVVTDDLSEELEELLGTADEALYSAKRSRGSVVGVDRTQPSERSDLAA